MDILLRNLWVFPLAVTAAIWLTIGRLPRPTPEDHGGFDCQPAFEISARITIAAAISIFVWLAYVTVQLKVLTNG